MDKYKIDVKITSEYGTVAEDNAATDSVGCDRPFCKHTHPNR